jgi:citrate lyase subunit beta/citryl-CoA lyase
LDFVLDINADGSDRFLDHVRAQLVLVSRCAGIAPPLDSPSIEIRDAGRISDAARLAKNFGFGGQLCIHPAQIKIVHDAFAPTDEEIRWAQSVMGSEGAAAQVDGQMVDRPVIERASRILGATHIKV